MMASKYDNGESQLSCQIRSEVHTMLKHKAVDESTPLRFYVEAGCIAVLNKSGKEVKKILEDFRGGHK